MTPFHAILQAERFPRFAGAVCSHEEIVCVKIAGSPS